MQGGADVRRRLESRLAQLLARTGKIEADLRRPGNPDWPERASESANDEVLERLGAAEREEVVQIQAALARLAAGRYGTCERCEAPISEERLSVLPATPICVACADRA